jgi:hypothetical protein
VGDNLSPLAKAIKLADEMACDLEAGKCESEEMQYVIRKIVREAAKVARDSETYENVIFCDAEEAILAALKEVDGE